MPCAIGNIELRLGCRIAFHFVKHAIYPIVRIDIGLFKNSIGFHHVLIGKFLGVRKKYFQIIVNLFIVQKEGSFHHGIFQLV